MSDFKFIEFDLETAIAFRNEIDKQIKLVK